MAGTSSCPVTARRIGARVIELVAVAASVATLGSAVAATPAVGDTYVYRISNGYNNEVRGKIQYRVEKVDADRVTVAVATDAPAMGAAPRTEIYTIDGNWLRHPVANHDQVVDYDFTPAYPAVSPPAGTSAPWSTRVNAVNPQTGQRNSVRVDGEVLGSERITTTAGTFDTIKVFRRSYAGDWGAFLRETRITETEWYAPALGRPVRVESNSEWLDISRCGRGGCPWFRGDWNIIELAEISVAKP